jgi:hypothetical protein
VSTACNMRPNSFFSSSVSTIFPYLTQLSIDHQLHFGWHSRCTGVAAVAAAAGGGGVVAATVAGVVGVAIGSLLEL